MSLLNTIVTIVGFCLLPLIFMAIECLIHKRRLFARERMIHYARNTTVGVPISLLGMLVPGTKMYQALVGRGLITITHVPRVPAIVLGFLVIELCNYLYHRAEHVVPVLWRFHRVHHSDPAMDASTNNRFHLGNILRSAVVYPVVGLCGVPGESISIWFVITAVHEYLQHSDITFPRPIETALRTFYSTPMFHRTHHSPVMAETNSNYGHIISVWDWLFGTACNTARAPQTGLYEYQDDVWSSVRGLFITPFADTPAPPALGAATPAVEAISARPPAS